MPWRPHGRAYADPTNPSAWAVCDRCAFWYLHRDLNWQFEWAGAQLQNLRLLVCDRCLDDPQPQLRAFAVPADPTPIMNARVENFMIDETNYLVTQSLNAFITQSGQFIVQQDGA